MQEKLHFKHTAEGWQQLRALVARHPTPGAWRGALRLDGAAWRELAERDPIVAELRLLCRDEIALIEQRTAFINQLRQCLHEYYPAALEAFDNWTCPGAWAFVLAFPSAPAMTAAGRRKWEKFQWRYEEPLLFAQRDLDVGFREIGLEVFAPGFIESGFARDGSDHCAPRIFHPQLNGYGRTHVAQRIRLHASEGDREAQYCSVIFERLDSKDEDHDLVRWRHSA